MGLDLGAATFHEGVGQPARAAADRRAARAHVEAALTIGRQVDLPRALAATCHAWQASLLATDGNWRGADAQLDRGYLLTREAVEAGELTEANGSRIGWMMGQQVAEVAIDSERPAMALRRLDTIRLLFGDPPSGWRPHSELARFAAEAGAGKLPPEAIQARAGGIAERFGVATPRRAWWVGATHLLASSHLLARGEGRRAEISLDYADRPVHMGTRGLEGQSGYGLRHLLVWGRQAASPGPGPRREMTAIRNGLDEVGAAAAAKRADTWLRAGTPEPPPPPVSMAYLGYERDGQTTDWLGDGD